MNIQILNIKTGTIKIKKQLTYTKTLQMALHSIGLFVDACNYIYIYKYMYIFIVSHTVNEDQRLGDYSDLKEPSIIGLSKV